MGFGSIGGPTALNFLAQNSIASIEFEETPIHSPHNFELENFDPCWRHLCDNLSQQSTLGYVYPFSSMFCARLLSSKKGLVITVKPTTVYSNHCLAHSLL